MSLIAGQFLRSSKLGMARVSRKRTSNHVQAPELRLQRLELRSGPSRCAASLLCCIFRFGRRDCPPSPSPTPPHPQLTHPLLLQPPYHFHGLGSMTSHQPRV